VIVTDRKILTTGFSKDVHAKIPHIHGPQYKEHKFDAFELSHIPAVFKIADFERIAKDYHVDQIRASIVANDFYDNFIRAFKEKKGSWVVVDGQHRLAALWLLHKYYNLKTYPITVIEYDEKDARNIYRKLNSTKALTVANWIKSYDNHVIPFFDELRDILSHDDGTHLWDFAGATYALNFAKTGAKGLNRAQTIHVINKVNDADITFIKEFVKALKLSMPNRTKGQQFRPTFIRPVFAVAYRYKLSFLEIERLITYGMHTEEILKNLDNLSKASYEEQVRLFTLGVKTHN